MSERENDLHVRVQAFIGEIAATPPGRGYARWNGRVCVGVHNLEGAAAQYIADRISALVLEVGLEPGEPGCAPDVIVMFSANGDELARSLVENEPALFRPAMGRSGTSLGIERLEEFAESGRPVRWWHVTLPVDARTGQPAIELPQVNNGRPQTNSVPGGPSRLHSSTRDDMRRAIVIVDSSQLSGTTWQALGDYLAFVSLAQIDPTANPAAFDSILNLFSDPAAYAGLTDWDRSYIRSLYEFNQQRRPDIQVNEIVSKMVRQTLGNEE